MEIQKGKRYTLTARGREQTLTAEVVTRYSAVLRNAQGEKFRVVGELLWIETTLGTLVKKIGKVKRVLQESNEQ